MKSFSFLLRREFWENRGAFFTLPLGIGGFFVFIAVAALTAAATFIEEIDGERFMLTKAVAEIKKVDPATLDVVWNLNLLGTSAIFHMVLLFVVFFYLLGSLYDDRRDRSILFWKSLPISDANTVLSKLVAGSLLAPALWVAAIAITQTTLLLITTIVFWLSDIPVYDYLWGPADPLETWLLLLASYAVQAFWMLPVWGWALLASSFARSKPFLWAVAPPVLLAVAYTWINATQYLRIDFSVWTMIGNRILGGVVPIQFNIEGDNVQIGSMRFTDDDVTELPITWGTLLERFTWPDMWWGILFGVVFIALAIYIRRYRDES
ncbi:MAG: hypothetical protein QNJ40_01840 [Xanthomonadales bacterium]|nr:hypothetical protein [Xanthomonadales bacterium]